MSVSKLAADRAKGKVQGLRGEKPPTANEVRERIEWAVDALVEPQPHIGVGIGKPDRPNWTPKEPEPPQPVSVKCEACGSEATVYPCHALTCRFAEDAAHSALLEKAALAEAQKPSWKDISEFGDKVGTIDERLPKQYAPYTVESRQKDRDGQIFVLDRRGSTWHCDAEKARVTRKAEIRTGDCVVHRLSPDCLGLVEGKHHIQPTAWRVLWANGITTFPTRDKLILIARGETQ